MKHYKKLLTILTIAVLFSLTSCQSNQTDEPLYPENEVPVNTTSEEAMQEFVVGLDLWEQNNPEKARPYFENALALDPNFVSAQMYRAFSSNSAKDFGENRDKFLAMRDNANQAEVLFMDILKADMDNDGAKELEISKDLVAKYPNSARAHDWLAGSYNGMDMTDKARAHWAKGLEIDSNYIPAIANLGFSYLFTTPKDFKKAEKYISMVVEKVPSSSRAHIDMGDYYRAQNDLKKALASYTKASQLDPEDEVSYSKAGHTNSFLGNYEAARKNFQDARSVSEFGTDSYNFESYTYLYEGDHKKALAFLMDAAKGVDAMDIPESNKTGTKMNCTFNCAMIAMHHGDVDHLNEVVELMKPLSTKIGEDVGSNASKMNQKANRHYWDAMASVAGGDYEEAAAKAEMIKTTLESSTDVNKLRSYHRVNALLNFKQENYEKALEHMAHLDVDNVYDKYWMAKAEMKLGNEVKAMEMFKEISTYNFNGVGYALIRNEVNDMLATAN